MGEISSATEEQSSGIGQVNLAIAQMDQATQQNAALVEQAAAAAGSLEEQARRLKDAVAFFQAEGVSAVAAAVAPRVAPKATPKAAPRKAVAVVARAPATPKPGQSKSAPADDGDWETF